MTGESIQPPEDDRQIRRRLMLEAVESAINDEDYDFMNEVLHAQDLLRPFETMEYMSAKRGSLEDPVEQRRWKDALYSYSNSLDGQEFPPDEAESMKAVIDRVQFDEITQNEAVAEEPVVPDAEKREDDEDWEQTKFSVCMDRESIDRIRGTQVFKSAEEYATGKTFSINPLRTARNVIMTQVSGEMQTAMLKVFDWYVYLSAESYAVSKTFSTNPLRVAQEIVNSFASSKEVQSEMKSALDKHVFRVAEDYAIGRKFSTDPLNAARKTIEEFASIQGRRDAMMRRLGFL